MAGSHRPIDATQTRLVARLRTVPLLPFVLCGCGQDSASARDNMLPGRRADLRAGAPWTRDRTAARCCAAAPLKRRRHERLADGLPHAEGGHRERADHGMRRKHIVVCPAGRHVMNLQDHAAPCAPSLRIALAHATTHRHPLRGAHGLHASTGQNEIGR